MTVRLARSRRTIPGLLGLLGLGAVALMIRGVGGGLAAQRDASYSVAHTNEVLLRAASLELHVQAAISEGRGYRITGDADDAARFGEAVKQADLDVAILHALTADNPGQQAALGRLELLVAARLGVLRRNAGLPGGGAAAIDHQIPPRQAAALMAQVTDGIRQFETEETRLLSVRRDAVARARHRINLDMAAGGAMLSAAIVLAVALAAGHARERHHVETLSRLNADLDLRVQKTTEVWLAAVEAVSKSEARQRLYLDNAPFAMAIMTPQADGQYVYEYMNLVCATTYGKPREHFLGRRLDEVWPATAAGEIQRRLTECRFVGEPFSAVLEQQVNGGWRYLDGALSPLGDSTLGPQQVLVCARDVTEKTLLEQLVAAQVEALRQAQERERRLFEATPAMLHSTGPDGALIAVSDAWLDRLGYTREEVIGRPVIEFLTEESRHYHQSVVMPLFSADGAYSGLEFQAVCKSGERVDLLVSASSERDAAGIVRNNAVVEDVTQRRRAERALGEERQRLSHIIEATGAATWEWNVQTGEVRFGDNWTNLLGSPPGTMEALRSLYHPADLVESDSAMALHLACADERFSAESRLRHVSGDWVWIHSQGSVMERGVAGEPLRVFGFAMDISDRKRKQQAMQRSEQFLQRTGECAGVGGWELDVESGQLILSAETARIYGVPAGWRPALPEAIAFYAPEARPIIQGAVDRCIADGTGWDLELPFIRSGGERIWVRAVGTATRAGGRTERLVGAFQDITAPVSQRVALQSANERVALATAGAGLGIWELDLTANVLVCDDTMRRLFGLAAEPGPVPRERWRACIHPEDREAADLSRLIESDAVRRFQSQLRVIWPDGTVHHIDVMAEIIRDLNGRALRVVGVDRDVTEARRLAAEGQRQAAILAESEANSRLILDNANDMISRVAADGHRLYVSAAVINVFGLSPEAFLACEFASLIHPDDLAALASAQARLSAGELQSIRLRFRVMHQQRGAIWVETAAQALSDPLTSAPAGYISVTRDVTEHVRIEAEREERAREQRTLNTELERLTRHMARARTIAEQANRAKTRFLAGMSHELRTPLNGILGYAQLLRMDGGLSAVQAERVQSMLTAGTHLLEMISCVLDLSEIETAGIDVQPSPVDVVGLAEASLNIVRPAAEAKHLALSLVAGPDVPSRVTTDPARLRQVLLNLLGNAIKYTPAGSVGLRLAALPPAPDAPHGRLRLEVADTGPGIPPDKAYLLFEEFERLDAAATSTVEGAGLGLSLAKRLTSVLGGALGYMDNPGGGSLFWLELPLLASEAQPVSAAPARAIDFTVSEATAAPQPASDTPLAQAEGNTGPGVPSRVLVVDDVAMNRDIAAAFIRSAGYEVVCAEGGEQAVAMAAADDFITVLMDVRMPGMDGLEATRRIRAAGGARARVPIVALTAQVFTEQIQACRAAGMDTHVAKPFTLETLLGAIARGVEAGHARDHGEAPAAPLIGCDLPTLVEGAYDRTAAVLSPAVLGSYLKSLAARADGLLCGLTGPEDLSPNAAFLAETAHALAGSAGMFGFDRLVHVARHFERAVKADASQASALAPGLKAALDVSLPVMRSRAEQATQGNVAA